MKSKEDLAKLKIAIEKTRKKGVYTTMTKIRDLQIKLCELNHPDFVSEELKRLSK